MLKCLHELGLDSEIPKIGSGLLFAKKTPSYGYKNPHYDDRLGFKMRILKPVRRCLLSEQRPWYRILCDGDYSTDKSAIPIPVSK